MGACLEPGATGPAGTGAGWEPGSMRDGPEVGSVGWPGTRLDWASGLQELGRRRFTGAGLVLVSGGALHSLPPRGRCLSPCWAVWSWGRGNEDNVKLFANPF